MAKIAAASQLPYFKQGARGGLGLGVGNENMLQLLKERGVISKEGFSVWLHEDQTKMYIGQEKQFFSSGNLQTYRQIESVRKQPSVHSPWTIKLDKVMAFNSMLTLEAGASPQPQATISTASGFLSFPNQHYKYFFDRLKNVNLVNCDDFTANLALDPADQKPVRCECQNYNRFPDITFYFSDHASDGSQPKYTIQPSSYLHQIDEKNHMCIVLVRMQNKLDPAAPSSEEWVLGAPFLRSVYTYFDHQTRSVQLGNLYDFELQPKTIGEVSNTVLIVLGSAAALIGLATLLGLLKQLTVVTVMEPNYLSAPNALASGYTGQPTTLSVMQNPFGLGGHTYNSSIGLSIQPAQTRMIQFAP